MKWQEFVKDYLTFTRKERIGVLVLLFLILLVGFAPMLIIKKCSSKPVAGDTTWISAMKKLERKEPENDVQVSSTQNNDDNSYAYQYDHSKNNHYDPPKGELFFFDPNTLSIDGWKKLGLKDKIIQTIQNYLNKGGHFKKQEDLQKIYGLRKEEYERLVPYIQIETISVSKNSEEFISTKPQQTENQTEKKIISRYSVLDINIADTTAFIALPGIGSKLAARIVNFREKLGGFYSIEQVGETFGLPDSTFQKIKQYLKLENASVKKINVNIATVDELKAHPYIKWGIASPIIAYRNEHGNFAKVEDIKKVAAVTEELYIKIAPYLTTQ